VTPLQADECDAICDAVRSAFRKIGNLYREITPIFARYGLTPPSPGVLARNLSEEIEVAIAQHCPAFQKGGAHHDLQREREMWEVKICQRSGLTINQSATIAGEHYVIVNYATGPVRPTRIWVLWGARDEWFSPRRANANARALTFRDTPGTAIQVLYQVGLQRDRESWLPLPAEKRS
jgi:hypothetical protein